MTSPLSSKSIYFTAVPFLQDVIKPLRDFGITNFIYVKNYKNGQFVHFSSRRDWLEHFYNQKL